MRSGERTMRGRRRHGWALALFAALGCFGGGDAPPELCFSLEAARDLHFYDGQPHSLALFVYPLGSERGIDQSMASEFLDGDPPVEVLEQRYEVVVTPGERRRFDQVLPRGTAQIVVIADYYRRPGDPPGKRLASLEPRCGSLFRPTLVLSASELRLE